jgi:hypothetical protein
MTNGKFINQQRINELKEKIKIAINELFKKNPALMNEIQNSFYSGYITYTIMKFLNALAAQLGKIQEKDKDILGYALYEALKEYTNLKPLAPKIERYFSSLDSYFSFEKQIEPAELITAKPPAVKSEKKPREERNLKGEEEPIIKTHFETLDEYLKGLKEITDKIKEANMLDEVKKLSKIYNKVYNNMIFFIQQKKADEKIIEINITQAYNFINCLEALKIRYQGTEDKVKSEELKKIFMFVTETYLTEGNYTFLFSILGNKQESKRLIPGTKETATDKIFGIIRFYFEMVIFWNYEDEKEAEIKITNNLYDTLREIFVTLNSTDKEKMKEFYKILDSTIELAQQKVKSYKDINEKTKETLLNRLKLFEIQLKKSTEGL